MGPANDGIDKTAKPLGQHIVGVSVSESEDLARLGLMPAHIDRTLAEIVTQLAAAGARVGYGGDLRAGGFTYKLFHSLAGSYGSERIATETPPFIHYLAYPIWKGWSATKLGSHVRALDGTGEVVLLRPDGDGLCLIATQADSKETKQLPIRVSHRGAGGPVSETGLSQRHTDLLKKLMPWWEHQGKTDLCEIATAGRDIAPVDTVYVKDNGDIANILELWRDVDPQSDPTSFSNLRVFMAADENSRVVLGGKTSGYSGNFPGLAEETLYSLVCGNIVLPLGAFGGCAQDIVNALYDTQSALKGQSSDSSPGYSEIFESLSSVSKSYKTTMERSGTTEEFDRLVQSDASRMLSIGVLNLISNADLQSAILEEMENLFLPEIIYMSKT